LTISADAAIHHQRDRDPWPSSDRFAARAQDEEEQRRREACCDHEYLELGGPPCQADFDIPELIQRLGPGRNQVGQCSGQATHHAGQEDQARRRRPFAPNDRAHPERAYRKREHHKRRHDNQRREDRDRHGHLS
jgi:hypothetical protein